uniref:DUF2071 domain-containing protein n=1 Tax=Schlesneria paludicola TaxID=360056 RepID=A0A7C4LMX0_9PLAN
MSAAVETRKAPVFLTAAWRWLVMLNFEVDRRLLLPHVPRGTELDLWQGRALVSLVGFRFLDTRIRGCVVPGHRCFDEVNLRLYVRRETAEGCRRGVVFLKEVVPLWTVAWVARRVYQENYITLPVSHDLRIPGYVCDENRRKGGDGRTDAPEGTIGHAWYRWGRRGAELEIGVTVEGRPQPLIPGTEVEFITEHYWGYTRQRDESTLEYEVEHPPWNVWPALRAEFSGDPAPLYGSELAVALRQPPCSAFLADGSTVCVRRGVRLPPSARKTVTLSAAIQGEQE